MKLVMRITLAIFFLIFFVNSYLTPLMGDDYAHFQLSRGGGGLFENLFVNLRTMYFSWGGRMLVHLFDGLILASQSRFLFSLVNLGCLILVLTFIYRTIAARSSSLRSLVWILGAFVIAYGVKSHFQVLYLTTGAANYFWSFGIIIAYLHFFSFLFRQNAQVPELSKLQILALCLLGFFTGSTNENVGVCLLAVFFLSQIECVYKGRPMAPRWIWLTQIFLMIGAVILILAPGNYVRMNVLYPQGLPSFGERLKWWLESFAIFLGRPEPLLFLGTLFGSAVYMDRASLNKIKPLFREYHRYLLLSFLMVFVFLGNDGNFYGRKGVHSFLIFSVFCIILFAKWIENSRPTEAKLQKVGLFIAILAIGRMGYDFYKILGVHDIYSRREAQILADNKKPARPIVTCAIDTVFSLEDLNQTTDVGLNAFYSFYIGVGPMVSNDQPCETFLGSK